MLHYTAGANRDPDIFKAVEHPKQLQAQSNKPEALLSRYEINM